MLIVFIIILIIVAIFAAKCMKEVPQNSVGLVETWGKYDHKVSPGLHFCIPVRTHIRPVSLAIVPYKLQNYTVITKDSVNVAISVALNYHVTNAVRYEYGNTNSIESMAQLVRAHLRDIIGGLEFSEVLNSSSQINKELAQHIGDFTNDFGINVDRINIDSLEPDKDIQSKMNEQKSADLHRKAQIIQAQGNQKSVQLKADGQKEANIEQAQGRKQSTELSADADYYQTQRTADAQNYRIHKAADAQNYQTHQIADAQNYQIHKTADAQNYQINQVANAKHNEIEQVQKALSDASPNYFQKYSIQAWANIAQSGNMIIFGNDDGKNTQSSIFGQIPAVRRLWEAGKNTGNRHGSMASVASDVATDTSMNSSVASSIMNESAMSSASSSNSSSSSSTSNSSSSNK